jgi:hypothetical protein
MAIVVGGCGGKPLTLGTSKGSGDTASAVSSVPAESVESSGTSAGGASEAANSSASDAGAVGTIVYTTYEGPPGGVLACGTSPTIRTVVEATVAPGSPTRPDGSCVDGAFKRGGVCTCQDGDPTVCGGTCVDTTRDPRNCGACGRSCGPTSTCNAGACGPPVTNVVPPAAGCGSLNLATSGGVLYWTDRGHGTVKRQALTSCEATTIVSGERNPTLLTTDGATLVWVTSGSAMSDSSSGYTITTLSATLRALTLPGGTPRDLVTETNTTGGILGLVLSADGATVYYSADTRVRGVPVAGGAAFDVGHDSRQGLPTALAREGNTLAFLTELNTDVNAVTVEDGVVASCGAPLSNAAPAPKNCIQGGGCNPYAFYGGLVLRDGMVYWADGLRIDAERFQTTLTGKASIATGWSDTTETLSGLAGGPDQIYFGTNERDGQVFRSPYAVGSPYSADDTAVAIARGQNVPSSMVVAGANVYWATADCAINGAPR